MACWPVGTKPLSEPMLELLIVPLGSNFGASVTEKMPLKVSSAKCRPICLAHNVSMGADRLTWVLSSHRRSLILASAIMWILLLSIFNTLRPRQNGRYFADDTFKPIFLNENIRISIKISLKFVPKVPINNIPALVEIMAWRRPGHKPLSELMMNCLLTHICVTRPQWVKYTWLCNVVFSYSGDEYQTYSLVIIISHT